MPEPNPAETCCPVFGVRSGALPIGIGIVLILFAVIPYIIGIQAAPLPVIIVFIAAGIFFMWMGLSR
jgi:hypothetical protein